jgi:MFS family permease
VPFVTQSSPKTENPRQPRDAALPTHEPPALEYESARAALLPTLQQIFRRPSVLLLMATFMGANFVATIFLTWTPTFLVEKFHFKLAAAGLSGSAFIHLASAVGAPLGGVISDSLSRKFPGGRALVQAAGLLLGAGFIFLVGTTTNVTTLLISMTIFGFGKGLYDSNIFAALYDAVEPRARGTAAGIMNTIGWGGGALGPLVMGFLAQHGRHMSEVANMSEVIAWTALIYIAGAIVLCVVAFVFIPRDAVSRITASTTLSRR